MAESSTPESRALSALLVRQRRNLWTRFYYESLVTLADSRESYGGEINTDTIYSMIEGKWLEHVSKN